MNSKRHRFSTYWMTRGLAVILAATLVAAISIHRVQAAAGDLDTSFGTGGLVITDLSGEELGQSVCVQSDGRIVVGLNRLSYTGNDFSLIRYNADGTVDTTFGKLGIAGIYFLGFGGIVTSVRIDAQGRILAAGFVYTSAEQNPDSDFALARFNPDGSFDATFGANGRVIRNLSHFDQINEIVLQADGKIVAAGTSRSEGGGTDFALFRLTSRGFPDVKFAGGGVILTDFDGLSDHGGAVALQSDGRIVVGGHGGGMGGDFALARYLSNGMLDTTFGRDGKITTNFSSQMDSCRSLLLRPNPGGGQQIIAAGNTSFNTLEGDFAMACYLPDGSLNYRFGNRGVVVTDFTGNFDSAHAALLQPDGKIVLGGQHQSHNYFALIRYNSNGGLDTSFGNAGKVTTDAGSRIEAMAFGVRGEIVAAGVATRKICLAKYLTYY